MCRARRLLTGLLGVLLPCAGVLFGAAEPAGPVACLRLAFEGSPQDAQGQKPVRGEALRYEQGKTGQGLAILSDSASALAWPTADRLDARRGVVEFWLQPRWDGTDKGLHWLMCDSEGWWRLVKSEWGVSFVVYHAAWKPVVSLGAAVIQWKAGEWHHLRLEWDLDGESRLLLDGKPAASKWSSTEGVQLRLGAEFYLGADYRGKPSADAVFDDFALYRGAPAASKEPAAGPAPDAAAEALLKAGVLALDFGPGDLPPRPGFVRVKASDTKGASLAWSRPVESALARKPHHADMPSPPPIERTLLEGDGVNTLRLAVAPGRHRVWLLTGDLGGVPPAFAVEANGKTVIEADQTVNFMPRVQTWRFVVEVARNTLSLEFRGKPRFVVCGCIVAPESAWAKAEEVAAAVEKELRLASPEDLRQWVAREHVETNQAPQATEEQTRRGFIVFARPSVSPVYPNTIPAADEIERPVRAFAAQDEYEPMTFGVYPLRRVEGLRAESSDLVGERGGRLGREHMTLRVARYRAHRLAWTGVTEYATVPELLERARPLTLDETKLFWLTVRVPADAPPGVYTGRVTLNAPGVTPAVVPLSLRVLPFSLPKDSDRTFGVYYLDPLATVAHPVNRAAAEARGTYQRMAELRRRDLDDMREHGIQTITIMGPRLVEKDGVVSYDASAVADLVEAGRKAGVIRRPMPGGCPWLPDVDKDIGNLFHKARMPQGWKAPDALPERFCRIYVDGVRHMQALARERGWPEILFYVVDEPSTPDLRRLAKAMCGLVHQVPGARTYVTGRADPNYLDDEFLKLIDVPCYTDLDSVPENPERVRGHWYYPNSITGACGDAPTARFGAGFGFWFSGLEGCCPWRYTSFVGNPDTDLDPRMTDFFLSYPAGDEHVPTLRWEQFREGIDDCRYMTALTDAISRAEKSDRGHARDAARSAREAVERLRRLTPTLSQFARGMPPAAEGGASSLNRHETFDRDQWCRNHVQNMRWTVAVALQRLQAALAAETPSAGVTPTSAGARIGIEAASVAHEPPAAALLAVSPAPAGPVQVDGDLAEPCWTRARRLSLVKAADGAAPREQAEAMVAADSQWLYAAFICRESEMGRLAATVTERDGSAWNDDCVEVFVLPQRGGRDFYHFIVSCTGALADAVYPDGKFNLRWNSTATAAVKRFDDRWQVELRVPLAEVGLAGARPAAINLCREQKRLGENTCWSPTGGAFAAPERFGRLVLPPSECYLAEARPPRVGFGPNEVRVRLANDGPAARRVQGVVRVRGEREADGEWRSAALTVPAGAAADAALRLDVRSVGPLQAEIEVRDAGSRALLDAETLALGRAEPVRLRCVSPFALRGQGLFRVPGRLRLSPALAEVAVLRVALLSHDGRELVSTEGPPPPGSGFVACLDPAALRDETHRLRVTLRAGPGMPTFSDQVDFGVLPSY